MIETEAEGFGGFKLKDCGIIPLDEVGDGGWGHIGVPRPRLRNNDNFAHPELLAILATRSDKACHETWQIPIAGALRRYADPSLISRTWPAGLMCLFLAVAGPPELDVSFTPSKSWIQVCLGADRRNRA